VYDDETGAMPWAVIDLTMPQWPAARSAAITMSGTTPASTPLGTCNSGRVWLEGRAVC